MIVCESIGQALYQVGREMASECLLLKMPPRELNGQEPPKQVAEALKLVDAAICPTSTSLTHTDARRNACAAGTRIGTMPGINEEVMIRTMQADYHKIAERTHLVREILDAGKEAHVTTAIGTDIWLPIDGIAARSSTGLVLESGDYGNLPSGEAFLMPAEGKARRRLFG